MRLIDADALKEQVCLDGDCTQCKTGVNEKACKWNTVQLNDVIERLESAPTIDAVPVVRCKDCIFAEQNVTISHSDSEDYTVTLCLVDTIPKMVDNYYFCAGGESKRKRKDNG